MTLDPTKVSQKFSIPAAQWATVDALYGGTQTMRAAGARLLPRNEKEAEKDWITRLNRTTLFNAYKRSIQQAVARAFAEDITLEGYSSEITIFSEDVDAQGRDLTQFSKALFTDAMNRGVSFVLIEFPRTDSTEPMTLADALASGNRPYWVPIHATQVLAAHSSMINGAERLTHFRFKEYVTELSADGLSEVLIEQVKAFVQADATAPVEFIVYRKVEGQWAEIDRASLDGMPQIPVVVNYTNRTGFFIGTPPLMDLAETNIAHWQSSSEQRNILHVARVPFLHLAGFNQGHDPETGAKKEQEISIHSVAMGGENSKISWVETNGRSLAAGAADLADLEAKMELQGLSLTVNRSGNITATETSVNAAEANSILKDYALALGDCIEQAIYLTGLYLGLGELSGRVVVSTRFAVDLNEPRTVSAQEQ